MELTNLKRVQSNSNAHPHEHPEAATNLITTIGNSSTSTRLLYPKKKQARNVASGAWDLTDYLRAVFHSSPRHPRRSPPFLWSCFPLKQQHQQPQQQQPSNRRQHISKMPLVDDLYEVRLTRKQRPIWRGFQNIAPECGHFSTNF